MVPGPSLLLHSTRSNTIIIRMRHIPPIGPLSCRSCKAGFLLTQFLCGSLFRSALACSNGHASGSLLVHLRTFSSARMAAFRRGRSPISGLLAPGATCVSAPTFIIFLGLPGPFFLVAVGPGSSGVSWVVSSSVGCVSDVWIAWVGSNRAPPPPPESGCAGAAPSELFAPVGAGSSILPGSVPWSSSKTYPTGTITATLWMGLVVNLGGDRSPGVFPGLVYLMLTVRT